MRTPDDAPAPRRRAVAMRYQGQNDEAPRVTAKGSGYVADRIIEIARENGVYIHEDPELVGLLSALEVQQEIPEDLYRAVAEVLAFVYRIQRRLP
jgi:flagellar biosynthesis protein